MLRQHVEEMGVDIYLNILVVLAEKSAKKQYQNITTYLTLPLLLLPLLLLYLSYLTYLVQATVQFIIQHLTQHRSKQTFTTSPLTHHPQTHSPCLKTHSTR